MKGKILTLSLMATTLSIMPTATTLAYLMDSVETTATFTTGQVSVQNYTASIGRVSNATNPLTGQTADYADSVIIENASTYASYLDDHCKALLSGSSDTDTCEKHIFVKNTGQNDTFVRVRILVPQSLVSGESPLITFNDVHTNTASAEEYNYESQNHVPCGEDTCVEYRYTYKTALPAGKMTHLSAVDSITYNGIADVGAQGENQGATSQALDLTTSSIRVYTEAIQAQGFDTAQAAFEQYNYQY